VTVPTNVSVLISFLYRLQVPLERRALVAAVDLADVRCDDRVLDVATGTGALLRELANRGQGLSEATGIDASPAMLRAGAKSLPAGYRLHRADAQALPFPDASFDVLFAVFLLHLLDGAMRARIAMEMHRVLRPGGRVITVTVHPRRPALRRLLAAMPQWTGLGPLDPRADLRRAGLRVAAGRHVGRGYPSLLVRAERR